MKARYHQLNLNPDFNPLDPRHVSNPECWLEGEMRISFERTFNERLRLQERAKASWQEAEVGIWNVINAEDSLPE